MTTQSRTKDTNSPTRLWAREIVSFSDSELDQYLKQNNRIVRVHDPNELPESFIQRLR